MSQVQIQRFLSVRNIGAARSAMFLSWITILLIYFVTCLIGLTIYTAYKDCTAGVFSASLSTISATSNSLVAIFLEDYLKPAYKKLIEKEFPKQRELLFGKILTFVIGIGIIGMAIVAQYLEGILEGSLTVSALTNGIVIGIVTLGMLFESATVRGAIMGILISLAFCIWMATGIPSPTSSSKLPISIDVCNTKNYVNNIINATWNLPHNEKRESKIGKKDSSYFHLYRISYVWYNPIACGVKILVGFIISNLTRIIFNQNQNHLDPDLFFPVIANRIKCRRLIKGEKTATEMKTRLQIELL